MRRGKLITFEGGEGCGKTTQVHLLFDYLKKRNYDVIKTEDPGGIKIAAQIRGILLTPSNKLRSETELFLFEAARSELTEKIIVPNLEGGKIILSDRFYDSSIAYQGYGGGIDVRIIEYLNNIATRDISPDLTILIDIDAKKGLERKITQEFGEDDRMEKKELEYHERVNQGFLEIAKREPDRVKVIPYRKGKIEEMHQEILKYVNEFLKIK